ncbi:MAG: helix-hairpin-helix domain-containing protein, partial [Acutalibacteraceae bacterium]
MQKKELLELCGSVEEIIYRNQNNGYTVMTMLCDGATATAVGSMPDVNIGDELKLIGNWKVHSSYGEQFAFEYYEQFVPSTAESILKYLSSGVIKGIGRATAKRLVDAFGDKTLEIMQNEPSRLEEIRGISHEKALKLNAEIRKAFGMREVMLYLEKYHISAEESVRIWKSFGDDAVKIIEENPYVLCGNNINVAFERADTIAAALEKPCDDKCRIRAG